MKQKIFLLVSMSFLLSSLVFGQMFQQDLDNPSNEKTVLNNFESTNSFTVLEMANGNVTYNINTGGYGTCANPPGIDETFNCATDGQPALDLGSFTDINPVGDQLTGIELIIYGACAGDVEFFLNGVSIASGTVTGPTCSCESIASDPFNPQYFTVTINPSIEAAFIIGGLNTLSVLTTNSEYGSQCFYGADVTIITSNPPSVPLSNWAIYISILLVVIFTVSYFRKIIF